MSAQRAVIDTNIFVSALMSPNGKTAKIHKMFLSGAVKMIYNDDILAEYQDVFYRPRLKIPTSDADSVLVAVNNLGEKIHPAKSIMEMSDEDDRIFYDTAKCAGAYLITGNTKHYPNESFILTPAAFLELPENNIIR
ncbi:MAG: putative toxin-antitoxin system toxin component, PIN family [Oscillospiraceae bacterium]|nr:putative toxin-antitoxin system toxin component, PIN family [Oscillospiraceae bacterium]